LLELGRSKEGTKNALLSGQKVKSSKKEIFIQLLNNEEILITRNIGLKGHIQEETQSRLLSTEIHASFNSSGEWLIENGEVHFACMKESSYKKEKDVLVHRNASFPYLDMLILSNNIDIALKTAGNIKSPAHNLDLFHINYKLQNIIGFDKYGLVVKNNGVNAKEHNDLMEKLTEIFFQAQIPQDAKSSVYQVAKYFLASKLNLNKNNPYGYVYTPDEHTKYIKETLEDLRKSYYDDSDIIINKNYSQFNLGDSKKEAQIKFLMGMRRTVSGHNLNIYSEIKNTQSEFFNYLVDFALFQKNNPYKTIESASQEELLSLAKIDAGYALMNFAYLRKSLEINGFRNGLKKFLSD
jgi:hypothetical protein